MFVIVRLCMLCHPHEIQWLGSGFKPITIQDLNSQSLLFPCHCCYCLHWWPWLFVLIYLQHLGQSNKEIKGQILALTVETLNKFQHLTCFMQNIMHMHTRRAF